MEFCAREAMQILGGTGYMRGNRVERIYREVRVNAIGGGSEEIMRDLAARQLGLLIAANETLRKATARRTKLGDANFVDSGVDVLFASPRVEVRALRDTLHNELRMFAFVHARASRVGFRGQHQWRSLQSSRVRKFEHESNC